MERRSPERHAPSSNEKTAPCRTRVRRPGQANPRLLLYAHRRATARHAAARRVLKVLAEGPRAWAIPWPCCHEFLALATNRRLWKDDASSMAEAWGQLEAWADSPSHRFLAETPDFLPILGDLVRRPRVRGPIVHDARIASICIGHGVDVLFTSDRDFSLFPELRTHDPLRG